MALDIATLGLKVDAAGATRQVDSFGKSLDSLADRGTSAATTLKSSFLGLSGALAATYLGGKFISESVQAQDAMAQLEAGVRSTGGAAGYSAQQLTAMAAELQRLTVYSDDTIAKTQGILLTFVKIKGDNFRDATEAVANMASRLGGLEGAAIQVGKALNDPIGGLTYLTRAGVQFSAAQKEQITALVQAGEVAQAQTIILKELEVQFGGSARAARDTLGGALKGLANDLGDLFEVTRANSGGAIEAINALGAALRTLGQHSEEVAAAALLLATAFGVSAISKATAAISLHVKGLVLARAAELAYAEDKLRTAVALKAEIIAEQASLTARKAALQQTIASGVATKSIRGQLIATNASLAASETNLAAATASVSVAQKEAAASAAAMRGVMAGIAASVAGWTALFAALAGAVLLVADAFKNIKLDQEISDIDAALVRLGQFGRMRRELLARGTMTHAEINVRLGALFPDLRGVVKPLSDAKDALRDWNDEERKAIAEGARMIQHMQAQNAVFGKGELALELVNLQYERLKSLAENARQPLASVREALDAQANTVYILAAAAARLNDAERERLAVQEQQKKAADTAAQEARAFRDATDAITSRVAVARQSVELATLEGDASLRLAAQYKAVNAQRSVGLQLLRGEIGFIQANLQLLTIQKELESDLAVIRINSARAADAERAEDAKQVAEEAARAENDIRENYLRQWQQTFSTGISGMLESGLRDWESFFDSILGLFRGLIADMAAAAITQKLAPALLGAAGLGPRGGSGESNAGGTAGGAAAAAASSLLPVAGAAVVGIALVTDAILSLGDKARDHARALAESARLFNAAIEDFARVSRSAINQAIKDDIDRANAIARDQAARVGQRTLGAVGDFDSIKEFGATVQRFNDSLRRGASPAFIQFVEQLNELYRTTLSNIEVLERENEQRRQETALRELNAAKQEAIRKAEEAQTVRRAQEDLGVRQLAAEGLTAEAEARRFQLDQQREYDDAVKAGRDAAFLAQLSQTQLAEAEQFAAEQADILAEKQRQAAEEMRRLAEENVRFRESLVSRGLTALGEDRAAEDATTAARNRQELADAIEAGMTETNINLLLFVQSAERARTDMLRAIEDGTKAIESARDAQLKAIDDQIDAINRGLEAELKAYDAQIEAINAAAEAERKASDAEIGAARASLAVQREQLQAASQAVGETRRVVEALKGFGDSLPLGDLSTLSPTRQLTEARRQFEELFAAASGGDKSAAARIPELAQALLNASRGVNASGPGYVSDFGRVSQAVGDLVAKFGPQLSAEESALAAAQQQVAAAERAVEELQATREERRETSRAQIDAIKALQNTAREDARAEIEGLEAAKDAIVASADAQIAVLIETQRAIFDDKIQSSEFYSEWLAVQQQQQQTEAEWRDKELAELRESNQLLSAAISVAQDGYTQTVRRLDQVVIAVDENTQRVRKALEGKLI